MVWAYNQSRPPLLWMCRQCLRLGAMPLEVGLLPLCPETIVSGTAAARWAALLRWLPRTCLGRQAWCPVIVCCTAQNTIRQGQTIQPLDLLQELIFLESGASQSWLTRHELLAFSAAAVCEHHFLPAFPILEQTWESGVSLVHQVRDTIFQPRSLLRERITADSWVTGTWLQRRDWLSLRRIAAPENSMLSLQLVLFKEVKPNLTVQDINDAIVPPPRFHVQIFSGS